MNLSTLTSGVRFFGKFLFFIFFIISILLTIEISQWDMPLQEVPQALSQRLKKKIKSSKFHFLTSLRGSLRSYNAVNIYIAPQFIKQIEEKKKQAIAIGILKTSPADEVPAKIVSRGQVLKVRMRLKGDWTDHLKDNKESFRIKVKKDKYLRGMKRISLQHDFTRGGHGEYFLYQLLQKKNILTPRFFRSDVFLNDDHRGMMIFEEHFSKEMLEAQARRESPIFAYDESPLWDQRILNRMNGDQSPLASSSSVNDTYNRLYFKVFQKNKVLKNKKLRLLYEEGLKLLRGYREGYLSFSSVFDSHKVGVYLAYLNAFAATHGFIFHNLRFYFNPISRLFEPIAFDNYVDFKEMDKKPIFSRPDFYKVNAVVRKAYKQTLVDLKKDLEKGLIDRELKSFAENHFYSYSEIKKKTPLTMIANRVERALSELPVLSSTDYQPKVVKPPLLAKKAKLSTYINVFFVDGAQPYLEFENNLDRRVTVKQIRSTRSGEVEQVNIDLPVENGYKKRVRYSLKKEHDETMFDVLVSLLDGEDKVHHSVRYTAAAKTNPFVEKEINVFLEKFPFVHYRKGKLVIKKGFWHINGNFVSPQSLPLTIESGVQLVFSEGSRFVHRGPLMINGEKNDLVVFKSKLEGKTWSGVHIIGSNKTNVSIKGVLFTDIDRRNDSLWTLTGALTIHDAKVDIDDIELRGNFSEDALNITNSIFDLKRVKISGTLSDAIDVDFGQGTMEKIHITEAGGDGIDISGTQLEVRTSQLSQIYDKALSIGELSQFTGRDINIEDVGSAMTSKDGSRATLRDSRIKNVHGWVYMAYVKKKEYGYPQLVAIGNEATQYNVLYSASKKSKVRIDNKSIRYQDIDVDKLYQYGRMKK